MDKKGTNYDDGVMWLMVPNNIFPCTTTSSPTLSVMMISNYMKTTFKS